MISTFLLLSPIIAFSGGIIMSNIIFGNTKSKRRSERDKYNKKYSEYWQTQTTSKSDLKNSSNLDSNLRDLL